MIVSLRLLWLIHECVRKLITFNCKLMKCRTGMKNHLLVIRSFTVRIQSYLRSAILFFFFFPFEHIMLMIIGQWIEKNVRLSMGYWMWNSLNAHNQLSVVVGEQKFKSVFDQKLSNGNGFFKLACIIVLIYYLRENYNFVL